MMVVLTRMATWDFMSKQVGVTFVFFFPVMIMHCYYTGLNLYLFVKIIWFNEYYLGLIRDLFVAENRQIYDEFSDNLCKSRVLFNL